MNKEQRKVFNQLWKVKILKEIAQFEDGWEGGQVTRSLKFDNERTLRLIEYGFQEGLKNTSSTNKENYNSTIKKDIRSGEVANVDEAKPDHFSTDCEKEKKQ